MAPLDNVANFVRQAVTSSVGTNDPETISVTNASALPDPSTDQYNLVIWDSATHTRVDQDPDAEVLRVTSRDTGADTITCDRGVDGTSNTSHPDTSEIIAPQTAAFFDDIEAALNELGDFTASPTEVTAPVNNTSTTTGELTNVADIIVEDGDDIDQAFTDLSQGDTMVVGQPATPYRNDGWLEPGVDGFTIIFQSRFAEDGQAIVKAADGANVGGIRVGNAAARSGWDIEGFGFDGNEANQTSGDNHGGVVVVNGSDFEIEQVYVTRTHPWQVHDTGGNGITVQAGSDYRIHNCKFFEIGDRGISVEGGQGKVWDVVNNQGYDRAVSVNSGDGFQIWGIQATGTADGSCVGFGGGAENITVSHVYFDQRNENGGKSAIRPLGGPKHIRVDKAFALGCQLIQAAGTGTEDITVSNSQCVGDNTNAAHGGRVLDSATDVTFENCRFSSGFRGFTLASTAGDDIRFKDCEFQTVGGDVALDLQRSAIVDGCETRGSGSFNAEIDFNSTPSVVRDHIRHGGGFVNDGSATVLDDVTV